MPHALRDAGYAVRPLRLTEFIKAGGSAKCLTLRLDGEEAAAWKHQPATVAVLGLTSHRDIAMNELYVVRHGIAVERGTPEHRRRRAAAHPEGRERMRQIGLGLRRLGLQPDRILTSPLPRAFETAEIVADALGIADRLEDLRVASAPTAKPRGSATGS